MADMAQGVNKTQAIDNLVSAVVEFETATPITDFPEAVSKDAKGVRARATELKDELMLLKQKLVDAGRELSKVAPSSEPSAPIGSSAEAFGVADRFASRIDSIADKIQAAGLQVLASQLDVVANSLEKKAWVKLEDSALSGDPVFEAIKAHLTEFESGEPGDPRALTKQIEEDAGIHQEGSVDEAIHKIINELHGKVHKAAVGATLEAEKSRLSKEAEEATKKILKEIADIKGDKAPMA